LKSSLKVGLAVLILALFAAAPGGLILIARSSASLLQSSQEEIARFTEQLKSSDEEERRTAVLMLSATASADAAPALVGALNDSSEPVRAAAVNGLAQLRNPDHITLISALLAKDKRPFVRKTAAYALGHYASAKATAPLVAALARDKDVEVRAAAVVALGHYKDPAAVAPLTSALKDKNDFIRAYAARALGVNGRASEPVVNELIRLLNSDPAGEVRRQAASALGLIGARTAVPALERASRSSDPHLSRTAIEALEAIRRQ
jgi:HEAT repeat protein